MLDAEQHMVIVKPVSAWVQQVQDGLARMTEANGGTDPVTLMAGADVDFGAFASVVEALVALQPHTGAMVGEDLIQRAGLKPVDQVIL